MITKSTVKTDPNYPKIKAQLQQNANFFQKNYSRQDVNKNTKFVDNLNLIFIFYITKNFIINEDLYLFDLFSSHCTFFKLVMIVVLTEF